ncbi:hypothetical protein F0L68_36085 [Solihabitans fulvus]|uniref:Uncharacterized protein n=1 Tax=Solihabitans fulvus TaxID=1892852 RepID=A0A5B2WKY1_9PSEU|nr:hypothetical protein F0L68_36085 [Solihabitans fulvus]
MQQNESKSGRDRGRGRPVWIAAGAVALAGAAIAGFAAWGGNSPAAYAVTKNSDGTVTVSIKDIKAIDQANAKLREFGVRAKAVPMTANCANPGSADLYHGSDWDIPKPGTDSVTLGTRIPSGYTILLAVSDLPGRGTGLGFTAPMKDPAPACVLDAASDPGQRSTK